jgi:peptide/nickel transport system permease protein
MTASQAAAGQPVPDQPAVIEPGVLGRAGGGQAGADQPARGSRGRHAGPVAASQQGGLVQRAAVARVLRLALAACVANPLATAGGLVVLAMAAFCFLGPLAYHTDQTHVFLSQANLPPGAGHPLGTDGDGVDELGRLMAGGQISLEVGASAGVLAALLGAMWGATSGYFGGVVDAIMMRIVDAAIAIPALVLLLLLISIVTPSTTVLVLVIAATSWLSTARLVRAEALTLRVREYVQAAQVMGGSGLRAIVRHIAPNAMGTIVVNVTFQIGNAVLILATLSWFGLGVRFPSVDWGDMIGAATQTISDGYWWQIVAPGAAISLVVVAFTMLGDGLRDGLSAHG